ncbi:adenylate kinase [Pseudoclavibacter endophyticus]|uniref:Uncharacterized protein n=1 Tax=Pseudoclavibacter endophyticus TaxID=1778590 RepID=A0A6H9WLT6_9MICO|nr:AAA family ATPase [Pseudoclavibacter endophyticus]KAB1646690.1 hypothetical protein F8O04_13130 [Pseudoclavibacter endophyticus]GGA76427.1 adenylate kinase [Pseudoclavibacter endophyticus]
MSDARAHTRILLIDGRSGSGKTTLADRIAPLLGATVVHLDDLYPGWGGLEAGSEASTRDVLEPLARGRDAIYRRWDWFADRYGDEALIEPGGAVIVEGCGALSRANRALADVSIWIELDETKRRQRALTRGGDDWWWGLWSDQERAFYARERSPELAHLVWCQAD